MGTLLYEFYRSYDAFLLQKLVEFVEKCGLMLIKELFSLQILIRRNHNVIKIAIGDFEVIETADIPFGCNLRSHSDIGHSSELALLHKAKLLRVVVTPPQGPAFLLLEFENATTLGVNFQDV
jgi:hypothetical protein